MNVVICNVPVRSEDKRTVYPPLGAMYVTQALLSANFSAQFYDINYFRPSNSEMRDYFSLHKPNIVGISATVSTSYASTKKIAALIREVITCCIIVVGGAITILHYTAPLEPETL